MRGKICVVTGANRGLGKATALELARQGATVLLVCRDRARGEAARSEIQETTKNATVGLLLGDLSSQQSVRDLAAAFLRRYNRLDVLINSAAVYKSKRIETADGLETMFATNHLGPFLFTNLLLDALKAAAPSRVINVTAPSTTKLNFDDLQGKRRFSAAHAFGASKACNLLFTYGLADRLAPAGVTVNAFFPGLLKSDLMREAAPPVRFFLRGIASPPEKAARALLYLASSPEIERASGRFFKGTTQSKSSDYTRNPAIQQRLWDASAALTHLA